MFKNRSGAVTLYNDEKWVVNETERKISLKLPLETNVKTNQNGKINERQCTDQNGRNEVQNERHKTTTMEHAMMKNRVTLQ